MFKRPDSPKAIPGVSVAKSRSNGLKFSYESLRMGHVCSFNIIWIFDYASFSSLLSSLDMLSIPYSKEFLLSSKFDVELFELSIFFLTTGLRLTLIFGEFEIIVPRLVANR